MNIIRVALGERSYPIVVSRDRYRDVARALRALRLGPLGIVITNCTTRRLMGRDVVQTLAAAGWDVAVLEVPDTERAKSSTIALRLIHRIARAAQRQTPTLFALGGGVVGDVTGYVASAFRRGVPYVQLPTTLLGQVDSAIGGKVGIDLPEGKNLVGAFYQPRAVFSAIGVLQTLPSRQLRSGVSEVIKYAAIADTLLLARLERRRRAILRGDPAELAWIVQRCAAIKARIVSRDERETLGLRTLLNFGHTVGHALEAAVGYSARLTHGEAIAIGMAAAADLGVVVGITPPTSRARLLALLAAYGLPVTMRGVSVACVERAMAFDKKFLAGNQRWVLVRRLGHAVVVRGVPPALVRTVMRDRIS